VATVGIDAPPAAIATAALATPEIGGAPAVR
jgi:hypothetical protein